MANGVTIDLIVDPKKAIQGLGLVENKSSSVANVLGKLGHVAAAGVAALGVATAAAGAATAAFVVSSVKAAAEAEKITAQTAAVLVSTGGAAGKSAAQIETLTKSLARMSGVDDETVKSAENVLLTFTAIKGTNFDEASQAVLNLSQSMGKDLNSSAILVGKALNNPIQGLTALTRVGVRFTDQQKQQITGFVKAGDVASAQAIILKELNTEFGGSAAAFGNTFLGSVGRAKTALEELREEVGSAFLPALTAGAGAVSDVLNAVTDNPKFKAFIDGLGTRVTNGLKPLTDFLTTVAGSSDPFGTLLDGIEKVSPAFTVVRDVFDSLKPQLPVIQAGFAQLGATLGAGLAQYGPQIAVAFGQIVEAIVPLLPQVLALIPAILPLVPPLLQLATTIIPPLATLLSTVLPPAIAGLTDVFNVLGPVVAFVVDGFRGGMEAIGSFFSLLSGNTSLQDFGNQLLAIKGPFGDLQNFFHDLGVNIANLLTGVGVTIHGFLNGIAQTFAGAGTFLVDAGTNLIQGFLNGINDAWKFVEKAVRGLFGGVVDLVKSVLGIHSPSTVFSGIGGYMIAGLEQGLSGRNNLSSIVSGLSSQVTSGFGGALNVQARASVTALNGGGETSAPAAASAVPTITQKIYMLPEQDPRIAGRQFGREFARASAGVPA